MPSYSGSCNCGALAFTVDYEKPMFCVFCHCRACSRARGSSPSHLLGVTSSEFTLTKGESNLKVGKGLGKMRHAFCSDCGCHIYQCPDGAGFRAILPVNFHIEAATDDPNIPCGKSSKLPDELMPTAHRNYENRVLDVHDDLPKFTAFSSSPRLNNDGTRYEE